LTSIRIEQRRRPDGPESVLAREQHDARECGKDSRDTAETEQARLILFGDELVDGRQRARQNRKEQRQGDQPQQKADGRSR
jgi:hypothetical protein